MADGEIDDAGRRMIEREDKWQTQCGRQDRHMFASPAAKTSALRCAIDTLRAT
jgi:hypothetical protein